MREGGGLWWTNEEKRRGSQKKKRGLLATDRQKRMWGVEVEQDKEK